MKYHEFYGEKWRPFLPFVRSLSAAVESLSADSSDADGRVVAYPALSHASALIALQNLLFGPRPVKLRDMVLGYYLYEAKDTHPVLCEAVPSETPNEVTILFMGESARTAPSSLPGLFYGPLRFFGPLSSMDLSSIERAWQDKLAASAKKPANETSEPNTQNERKP